MSGFKAVHSTFYIHNVAPSHRKQSGIVENHTKSEESPKKARNQLNSIINPGNTK